MQVLQMADTAFYLGMIDMSQRIQASIMQLRVAQLIGEGMDLSTHTWHVSGIMLRKASALKRRTCKRLEKCQARLLKMRAKDYHGQQQAQNPVGRVDGGACSEVWPHVNGCSSGFRRHACWMTCSACQ